MNSGKRLACAVAIVVLGNLNALAAEQGDLFDRGNLVAWCIVPFDAKKRGPQERAEMVARLGLTKVAYDWREEHVPMFERETNNRPLLEESKAHERRWCGRSQGRVRRARSNSGR